MDEQRRRDDVIERELNLALRTTAAAAAGEPHLDAEAAAAWMDRRLDARAAQSIEAHLAACADCQTLVSTLARITPVPEDAAAAAGGWSWWRRPWLVPAAAAAALAIVVWVSQAGRPAPEPESIQARAEEKGSQVLPEDSERLPKARSFQESAATAPGGNAAPESLIEIRRAPPPMPTQEQLQSAAVAAQPDAPTDADRVAAEANERADAGINAEQPALDAQAAGKVTVAGAMPAAPPPAATPPATNRQESAASAAPSVFRENARAAAFLRAADLTVAAADGTGRWRRAGGSVEFAASATARFAAATLPLEAAVLTAGSSPAGTVCWLVGRAGAVLVTSDGIRFIRVNPPAASDLVSVAATDARSATVTAADGRRFRTADAGGTWTLE